jgi:hypothetical protein
VARIAVHPILANSAWGQAMVSGALPLNPRGLSLFTNSMIAHRKKARESQCRPAWQARFSQSKIL